MKKIELTQNKFTIVDDEDFNYLSQFNWYYTSNGYAARNTSMKLGKRTIIRMHVFIMQTPKGLYTDHINNNRLDNRRLNLRICNSSGNRANSIKRSNNTSGYIGVYWHKRAKKWEAQIRFEGKSIYLGLFTNKKVAALTYDAAARKYNNIYAKTNFEVK